MRDYAPRLLKSICTLNITGSHDYSQRYERKMSTIYDGIAIGGAGGAIAGITVYLVQFIHQFFQEWMEIKRIYAWMKENTSDERGRRYCSTRAIASWNNLTEERIQYLCSRDPRIFLSTEEKKGMWSIYIRTGSERDDEGPRVRSI